jgi:hypothetical protein
MGGLVVIADLATLVVSRGAEVEVAGALDIVNLVLNAVFYSFAGAALHRESGRVGLGTLAGLVAGLLDGLVVGAASALSPTPGADPPLNPAELWLLVISNNVILGTLLATTGALIAGLTRRKSRS